MQIDLKSIGDVLKLHQQIGQRFDEQLEALRKAKPADLPALVVAANENGLQRAQAALAQAQEERQQGVRRLDERIKRYKEEVVRLEAEVKLARDVAAKMRPTAGTVEARVATEPGGKTRRPTK